MAISASRHSASAPHVDFGRVPKSYFEGRLIRCVLQWIATPVAMLLAWHAGLPPRVYTALTIVLLAWLFWTVLRNARADCPYCGTDVVGAGSIGIALAVPSVCPSCASDLTRPFDPAPTAAPRTGTAHA